jgi:hypothetical protein
MRKGRSYFGSLKLYERMMALKARRPWRRASLIRCGVRFVSWIGRASCPFDGGMRKSVVPCPGLSWYWRSCRQSAENHRLSTLVTVSRAVQSSVAQLYLLYQWDYTLLKLLAAHPLAVQLQSCESVKSITTVLQGQAQTFNGRQGNDRVMKSIKNTVSILTRLSATASLAVGIGLVRHRTLITCALPLTVSTAIPTCESSTRWSRYPTCCMCHSPVHILYPCDIQTS